MALWTSPEDPLAFLNAHGAFVVMLGTFVIAIIMLPRRDLMTIWSCYKVVGRKAPDRRLEIVKALVKIASTKDTAKMIKISEDIDDLFLHDAVKLLVKGFDSGALNAILRRRLEVQKERESGQARIFKTLGKYPPACGLVGTVMGMIALLGTLGQAGSDQKVGPAMAVALAATLYGVILSNFVILPVGDHLLERTQQTIAIREMIVEGILLIQKKTSSILVHEMMLSHLPPTLRDQLGESSEIGIAQAS